MSDVQQQIWELIERAQGEIAAEIRVMLGEAPIASSNFTPEDRQRRVRAMRQCAAESTSDVERHEAWMQMHRDSGWVYGPVFDSQAKTHPNMLPWAELPESVRSKARIFDRMAKLGLAIERLVSPA